MPSSWGKYICRPLSVMCKQTEHCEERILRWGVDAEVTSPQCVVWDQLSPGNGNAASLIRELRRGFGQTPGDWTWTFRGEWLPGPREVHVKRSLHSCSWARCELRLTRPVAHTARAFRKRGVRCELGKLESSTDSDEFKTTLFLSQLMI